MQGRPTGLKHAWFAVWHCKRKVFRVKSVYLRFTLVFAMAFIRLLMLFLVVQQTFAGAISSAEEEAALALDDQCQAGDEQCALNAIQLRGQIAAIGGHEQEWSPFGTTEKCCRCKSNTVGWSASGKCSFCKGSVSKTKSVSSDCTVKSKTFKGNTACANSCKTSVLLEELAPALVQTEEERKSEMHEEQAALAEDEAIAEDEWSPFGTTEKCCKCKSSTVGWSASGKCSFCKGSVSTTKSVSSDCTVKSKTFKGNTACANNCKKSVLLQEPLSELDLLEVEDEVVAATDEEVQAEQSAVASDEAIATEDDHAEFSPFGTTEKCCKCKTGGTIGWTASGKCSFCKGSVSTTKSVSSDCTVKSKTFKGNTACANSCKTTIGSSSSSIWR
mmetsp:Transcript_140336/g.448515  ORF Transcript_140336/g.448515 Transcript_140336/m.448515 type:complete len:387 (+) Transcript_140336:112-1272(+)